MSVPQVIPTGAVLSKEQFKKLIALSDQYSFVIASDECYSELWFDQAPIGLLEVCAELGRYDYKNCIVFHSLSKRSNLPGMRSGFVAGDAALLKPYLAISYLPRRGDAGTASTGFDRSVG